MGNDTAAVIAWGTTLTAGTAIKKFYVLNTEELIDRLVETINRFSREPGFDDAR